MSSSTRPFIFAWLLLGLVSFLPAESDPAAAPQTLSIEDARVLVARSLADQFSSESGEWNVEFVRLPELPTGTDDLEVTAMPARPTSAMLLRMRFLSGGSTLFEGNVAVSARLMREVLVSREPITRGQAVDPYQFDARQVDVLRENGAVGLKELANGDFLYYRSIPAGRILNWRDIVRRPVVQRGQIIEVAAIDGTLSVVLKGLALEDGAVGELIRIRNPESRREIAALVVGEGRAEIRL